MRCLRLRHCHILLSGGLLLAGCSHIPKASRSEALTMARSTDSVKRIDSVYYLTRLRDAESRAALRQLAADPDMWVRADAIEAIRETGDREAYPILVNALYDDTSWPTCRQTLFLYIYYEEKIALIANTTLEHMTWHHVKLDYDATPAQRDAAAREWRRYLKLPEPAPVTAPANATCPARPHTQFSILNSQSGTRGGLPCL